jgi:cold shock CspA family protein
MTQLTLESGRVKFYGPKGGVICTPRDDVFVSGMAALDLWPSDAVEFRRVPPRDGVGRDVAKNVRLVAKGRRERGYVTYWAGDYGIIHSAKTGDRVFISAAVVRREGYAELRANQRVEYTRSSDGRAVARIKTID